MKECVFVLTQIGEPIPGEHTFDANDEAGTVRCDGVQEGVGAGRQIAFEDSGAGMIENVREHAPCVQIDAGIECVRLLVKAYGYLLEKDEPS
jgi:hypothetical protein